MTSYRVTYQIRRREGVSISQGDWQDKEVIVVAGDDAMDAIWEVQNAVVDHDFRLRTVEVRERIDIIVQGLH